MMQVLGHLLPIALASALSSVPIMATILILLSKNKRRSAVPYLVGWTSGIAIVFVGLILLTSIIPEPGLGQEQQVKGIALIMIGFSLVAFAVIVWRRSSRNSTGGEPKWLSSVGSLGPWASLGLGVVLNLRPKSILLSSAAALSVHGGALTAGGAAVVVCIYTILSASTVAVPVIGTLVAPAKTEEWLLETRAWIAKNSRTVTILMLLMIGVVIVGNGLTRL